MYRPAPSNRDRAVTIFAVVLIHAGLAYAFLNASGSLRPTEEQPDLQVFDVTDPPPPPVVEQLPEPEREKPKEEEGAASAPNIESKATPVVAPPPRIALPIPQPMPVTETPNTGNEPTQGAAPVPGPGTGAGGVGTGTGSGGSGSGTGGGGSGGARATLLTPTLSRRDYPDSIYRRWPRGGSVFIIVRVGADGVPISCRVARSFGDRAIDAETCRLAVKKFRFQPGRDEQGRPVADYFGYRQDDTGRLERR